MPSPQRSDIMTTQPNPHLRRPLTAALILLFAAGSAASFADSIGKVTVGADDIPSTIVHFSRRNLDSGAGQNAVYRQLARAAEHVCRPLDGKSLREISAMNKCIAQSLTRAVQAVNAPALTALHASRTRPAATS
jgi:UrcA family protein